MNPVVLLIALGAAQSALIKDCDDCAPLAVIPAGQFQMGADGGEEGRPEGPVHNVTIGKPFAMAATEVTNAQYARFVKDTGHTSPAGCEIWPKGSVDESVASWREPGLGYPIRDNEPVVCVSWRDAKAFVAWLSEKTGKPYRLPTEAEWEYAARADTTTPLPWDGGTQAFCTYANVYDQSAAGRFRWASAACNDGAAALAPVGRYAANAFGLHDMIGNVWEWVEDCYLAPYAADVGTEAPVQPAQGSDCARRSVRGGSWMTRPDRNTVTFRGRDPEDARYFMFGFRVARDLLPGETR